MMKKDRQCGGVPSYPVYPQYQGMPMGGYPVPGAVIPTPGNMPLAGGMMQGMPYTPNMGVPNMGPTMIPGNSVSPNTIEQQMNSLEQQITLLDKRITNLENMYNSSNAVNYSNSKYSSSNYQMM